MKKVVEASIMRLARVNDAWFRFTQTDELLLELVQVRAAVAVLSLEDLFDGNVEINGKSIMVKHLVDDVFEKIQAELLKRVGAVVDEDDHVALASFEENDAGVERVRKDMPPITLQFTGEDSVKVTIYKEVD
jgi:hypothetical protein